MFQVPHSRPALLPPDHPPVLCVVVDTEEEFNWAQPFSRNNTSTRSIAAQPLVHERIYDKLGIVPTYVVDWPVATTPSAWQTLKGLMDDGRCEIGTHLHPWVSPPHTEDVNTHNSYTGNLPPELEFEKLRQLTQAITDNFKRAPTVFKAGRYGLGPHTFDALAQLGYQVDASIVPHTRFTADGGPDFSAFNNTPFWFGPQNAPLLELPVTTGYCGMLRQYGDNIYPSLNTSTGKTMRLGGIAARTGMLERIRLSPEGCTTADLTKLMKTLVQDGCKVLSLTYHSPSLQVGHTPYVKTQQEFEIFLRTILDSCNYFKDSLGGKFDRPSILLNKIIKPVHT